MSKIPYMPTPLTYDYGAAYAADRPMFSDSTGSPAGHATVCRAVECYNACEGIDDPAAVLAEVRAALAQAGEVQSINSIRGRLLAALVLLGGKP